jgi:hypothetical protein
LWFLCYMCLQGFMLWVCNVSPLVQHWKNSLFNVLLSNCCIFYLKIFTLYLFSHICKSSMLFFVCILILACVYRVSFWYIVMFCDWCNMEKSILFLFCYQFVASFVYLHFVFVVLNNTKIWSHRTWKYVPPTNTKLCTFVVQFEIFVLYKDM